MPSFKDSGQTPRFQSIPSVLSTTTKEGAPAITAQCGFRQFEWSTRVSIDGGAQGSYEAGLIQYMIKCVVSFRYSTGLSDN